MKKILKILIFFLFPAFFSGCIHTYPDAEAEDPTLASVSLRLTFPDDWESITTTPPAGTRLTPDPYLRLITAISTSGHIVNTRTDYFKRSQMKEGIETDLPPLQKRSYDIRVWCDFSEKDSETGLCFDASDLSEIRYLVKSGERRAYDDCFTGNTFINLVNNSFNDEEAIEIKLQRPMARYRLVARDYSKFIELHEKEIKRGESYTVKINYHNNPHIAFNLAEDSPTEGVYGSGFSVPLEIITTEGVQVELASDIMFLPPGSTYTTIDMTILNSSLLPVAAISDISIPLERGKETTLSGKLLTNLLSTGIDIDNEWGEEIEINIE